MSFSVKLAALWPKKPAMPPAAALTYGVVVANSDDFSTRAAIKAAEVIGILKAAGHATPSESVSTGDLSTIENHRGVRFTATPAQAKAVADALPRDVVIRSDCRVICPTPTGGKAPRCEID